MYHLLRTHCRNLILLTFWSRTLYSCTPPAWVPFCLRWPPNWATFFSRSSLLWGSIWIGAFPLKSILRMVYSLLGPHFDRRHITRLNFAWKSLSDACISQIYHSIANQSWKKFSATTFIFFIYWWICFPFSIPFQFTQIYLLTRIESIANNTLYTHDIST